MFCLTGKRMLGRLPPFDYHRPSTLDEVLDIIDKLDGNFRLLAGGTDLLVAMKEKRHAQSPLIDIKHIPGIGDIRAQNGHLRLGGGARARAIAQSALVRARLPVLSQAATILGSMQIGNRATIGGNLANASPAADCAPPLLVLGGSVKLVGVAGERWVPLENFFVGPKKTVINREVLTEIRVPTLPEGGKGVFCKLGLRAAPEDIAIVSVAIFALPDDSSKNWKRVRIALGAVAPTPIRAHHAEEALTGQPIAAKIIEDASRLAAEKDAQPITDIRGSATYRRAMVEVLVQRLLAEIADNTKGKPSRE
jgi:carbon-monoxide dehydrogenase medium subunit